MKIPEPIQIMDTYTASGPRMTFGVVGENTPDRQLRYLAQKINEIIAYMRSIPELPNEADVTTDNATGEHIHNWIIIFRNKNIGLYECSDCHEKIQKAIPYVGKKN